MSGLRSKRRRRRFNFIYIKLLFLLLIIMIGLPLLLVKGLDCPWFKDDKTPIVHVWQEDLSQLMKMTLEEYIKGVVAAEMPVSFEIEALKAQAVAARTYAYRRIVNNERIADHPEAHLSTDYRSGQAWISWESLADRWGLVAYYRNKKKISQAVDETRGVVALFQDEPILAVYHSTSGGRTESSEHYWTSSLPYLRSVSDPYGQHSPWTHSQITVPSHVFFQAMDVSSFDGLQVVERYPSGRVKILEVGGKWFSGREVRQRLGLRSTWFTVEIPHTNSVELGVWGYGHGVGMSQYGADGMAKQGYDYKQILKYYYQGITLKKIY